MRVSEAKDFLVEQTAQQAVLDGVPLSSVEKRMMYFTEGKDATEDPVRLNDEFEAEYETGAYEAKIGKLLRHAHTRVRKESLELLQQWNDSVRTLKKGDHYLLVLLDEGPDGNPIGWLLGIISKRPTLTVIVALGLTVLAAIYISEQGDSRWLRNGPNTTHWSMPVWMQRSLFISMVAVYFYYLILPRMWKRPPVGDWLVTLFRNKSRK